MRTTLLRVLLAGALFASLPACAATTGVAGSARTAELPVCASRATCEQRAAGRLAAVRNDQAALAQLLGRFPKGGDLHNHVAGAVYAESYLAWAREDGLRIDGGFTLVDASKCGPRSAGGDPQTPGGCSELPASPQDARFETILRAWSMKDFQPGAESGHDHFFAAFSRFGLISHSAKRDGQMLAETMRRAADDGAIYLEVLVTVTRPLVTEIAKAAGEVDPGNLSAFVEKLHADPRWGALIATSREAHASLDRGAREVLRCGTPAAEPACDLTVRYLGQVGRTSPAPVVFAEMLSTFEISAADPSVAGVNLVSPEDNATALKDYDLQMAIVGHLKEMFRGKSPLRVTLHAGELTPAFVPPAELASHVRKAVEVAHAERIGHGVDVLGERDSAGLLAEMRERGVTVEICLTSNAVILGVSGAAHPLGAYLAAGVPATLATDDPGVSRSSLTGEYQRAITVQGLTYPQIKTMARRSLEAAFVPGASLWASFEEARPAGGCVLPEAPQPGGVPQGSEACSAYLAASPRARLQWKLEGQLAAFEAQ
jgi:adenosine deaminase